MSPKDKDLVKTASSYDERFSHEVWLRLAAFLDSKSPGTQRTYESIVREWTGFLGHPVASFEGAQALLHASDLHVIAYKRWLESQPGQESRYHQRSSKSSDVTTERAHKQKRDGTQSTLSNATINKKFSALRRMYRVLIAAEIGISSNPFDVDKVPPPPPRSGQKRPTEMVDFERVKDVLNAPDVNTEKGLRDFAMLSLLFGAGLRRSEVVGLCIGDVRKSSSGTPYVRLRATKGRKDSDQALPSWAAEALMDWLFVRKQQKALSGDPLFTSYIGRGGSKATNNALSDSGLYKLFKKYCKDAGIEEVITPHSARATAITKLLQEGFGHREVQEFSRHASVQMVEVYDKRRLTIDDNPGKTLDYD